MSDRSHAPQATTSGTNLQELVRAQAELLGRIDSIRNTIPADSEQRADIDTLFAEHQQVYDTYCGWLQAGGKPHSKSANRIATDSGTPLPRDQTSDIEAGFQLSPESRHYIEAIVLVLCAMMVLHTYSGPRSIFAILSFICGIHMTLATYDSGVAHAARAEPSMLHLRLACLYLGHWCVDTFHLWLWGTEMTAVSIGNTVLSKRLELGILFSVCLVVAGASRAPGMLQVVAVIALAQGVLAMRIGITWRLLCQGDAWSPTARTQYLRDAMICEVGVPLLALFCSHLVKRVLSRRKGNCNV